MYYTLSDKVTELFKAEPEGKAPVVLLAAIKLITYSTERHAVANGDSVFLGEIKETKEILPSLPFESPVCCA
jgi:hypothetical protein